jgi:hypothetical protein
MVIAKLARRKSFACGNEVGFWTVGDAPISRPSGIFTKAKPLSVKEYFFGRVLVNADAAVESVRQRQGVPAAIAFIFCTPIIFLLKRDFLRETPFYIS